ncbi:MAG: glutamate--tRNA ligase [Peptococcia bacterium]
MEEIRVRFAPSPTGPLHIGGARSALFNYLFARGMGGKFILRIEDTDLERSSRESEEDILNSLRWLGLDWDEGPDIGGPYGPYRQTERLESYRKFADQLLESGQAYHCFCSEEELEAQRQEFISKGELPRYNGKCFSLTAEEKQRFIDQGRKPVVRFRVPQDQVIVINDLVRGQVSFESNGIGDFVIVKSDGIPTYNFAVVIDDSLMKISHVIRAEEHLSNTPRQILVYQALGLAEPQFAHVSLILGEDRTKMSKRHGATSVIQYQELGYLPEALVNFLALLGWSPEGEEEIFTKEELFKEFSLSRVAKNPAIFDQEKLRWINGMYIRKTPREELLEKALPFLKKAGFCRENPNADELKRAGWLVATLQERLSVLSELPTQVEALLAEDVTLENEEAELVLKEETVPLVIKSFLEKVRELPALEPDAVRPLFKAIQKELNLKGKQVFMPIRVALTGQMHGPELHYIISIMGQELIEKRIVKTTGIA